MNNWEIIYWLYKLGSVMGGILVLAMISTLVLFLLYLTFISSYTACLKKNNGIASDEFNLFNAKANSCKKGLIWSVIISTVAVVGYNIVPSQKEAYIGVAASIVSSGAKEAISSDLGQKTIQYLSAQLDESIAEIKKDLPKPEITSKDKDKK